MTEDGKTSKIMTSQVIGDIYWRWSIKTGIKKGERGWWNNKILE